MSEKRALVLGVVLAVVTAVMFINSTFASEKTVNNVSAQQTQTVKKNQKTSADVLSEIDKYQTKYFEIIKRDDLFLQEEETSAVKNDRKELKKLFKEVKKQVKSKDNLKKYKEIEKRYAKCEEETTVGMNEFANNNYKEVDTLLNEVYREVKTKISPADFKKLTASEQKWLNEVKNYKKVFDSKGFGTIGTIIYYDYEINMRQFRTLLLMLYL